jgi:hypothetical protein
VPGGVVAVADPGDDGTNASGQQHSTGAKKPKDQPGGTDSKNGSLGSGGQSGQQHSTAAKKPKDEPGGTDTEDGTPVVDGVAGIHGPGLLAAAGASVASRLPLGLPLAGISARHVPVSRACR